MDHENETLADDKLRGADAISSFIDEPRGRTYYMLESGLLPAGKIGRTWVASKAVLRAHYARITNPPPLRTERPPRENGANGLAPARRGRPRMR
jgi:hypothetical protein